MKKPLYPIRPLRIVEQQRKSYLPHILTIACAWLAVMTMDYHEQAAQAHEVAERMNAEHTACLRGEWRATTEQGSELGCMPVEQFDPTKHKKHS